MTTKNRNKLLIIAAVLFTSMTSCDSILDVTPKGTYTTATYWRNQSDAINGITGIYNVLLEEDFTGHAEFTFDDPSDDQYRAGDHSEDVAIENLTYDAANAQVRFGWRWKYEMINRANSALIYIPKITSIDEAIKNRCLGEARFLRAFAYWRLMLVYGEAPVVSEDDVLTGNYNKPKVSIDSLRGMIQTDLLAAADLLPDSYEGADRGRVSKGTAWGLLCKLYMYWEKLDQAIIYGEKVINSGKYNLAPTYVANFTPETSNNDEMLFAVQTSDTWGYSDFTTYYTPREWNGWNFHQPLKQLVDEFEQNDARKAVSIMSPGDKINIGSSIATYNANMSETGYHFRKFSYWKPNGGLNYSLKTPLLRTADIMLLVAEAKIRTTGAGAGDAEINKVRKRAGLGDVAGAGMPAVIHERRMELSGENERHQDLMRWDKAGLLDITTYYNKPKYGRDGNILVQARNFIRPKHYYFPLPQTEIDKSNGVLKQNENY
ncbi:RagB/SusD family nutrient uptake outer membrane protein [Chitinophaga pinensis]|uniref:RagB/SusD family nutrient uptake outer membrane protein n=1 Tax=Chitinophaga pinensis TaxID=79329 RepID=A0A5C6LNW8_9BACT|nr:RagB/SusD family nutrient uptake outer membrane protein [Chitinophaga pinensis]TWV98872.1 RagB/SusD family nutrient uptake outer membrane protein [Chitinophaga pinensis]